MHARPAPPVSLTQCWDRAKWHYDAAAFPRSLGRATARAHIAACLGFLGDRDQLTAEGRRQRGEALLDVHVRRPAHAFLDESYDLYLARTRYGAPAPVDFLRGAWADYEKRFDLRRASKPTPYQALLARVPGRSLDDLLWELRRRARLAGALRAALASVPPGDRPLVEATLALHQGNPLELARRHEDPTLVLFAMRYLGRRAPPDVALEAIVELVGRLDTSLGAAWPREKVESLCEALRLDHPPRAVDRAMSALAPRTRRRLLELRGRA